MQDLILQVENLKKTYGKGDSRTEALKGISFDVRKGELLGIMGPSGSGKTTLLNCIATMIRPSFGKVVLNGRDISSFREKELSDYRGKKIGYLFQEFELLDNLTVRENIELPLSLHGISESEAETAMKEISDKLDITEILDKFPSQVSGGQKQRAAAARALISDPEILLPDELKGLDLGTDDYLTKPCPPARLLKRAKRLIQTYSGLKNYVKSGPLLLDTDTWKLSSGENSVLLAENEGKIIRMLMERGPGIVTKEDLFHAIWGTETYIDENILQVNISRLRKKLADYGFPITLENIRGKGYVLRTEDR